MLMELLGKCPQVKTINFLLAHPFHKYNKKDLAQGSEISRITLDKFIEDLVEKTILIKDKGHYSLNKESDIVTLLDKLQLMLADMEAEKQIENFNETISINDEQLNELLAVEDNEFDEDEELILVERKELKRLQDLEKQYKVYAEKQMELATELLKVDSSKKELSHLE